jgi:hypothetical protein
MRAGQRTIGEIFVMLNVQQARDLSNIKQNQMIPKKLLTHSVY